MHLKYRNHNFMLETLDFNKRSLFGLIEIEALNILYDILTRKILNYDIYRLNKWIRQSTTHSEQVGNSVHTAKI